jgi:hypothetical protein
LGTYPLIPHPDMPPRNIDAVDVRWFEPGDGTLILRYQIKGAAALVVPAFAGKGRADDLWHTTCCELFLRGPKGERYVELNFSPSQRWAAYEFERYRHEKRDAPIASPEISASAGEYIFVLTAVLDTAVLGGFSHAGLSAVIEEKDGTKSYWALAHGPGQPDFHDPACFALALPAATGR